MHESDSDRRVFVGYVLTVVSVLLAIISVARGVALGHATAQEYTTAHGWFDRIVTAARGNQLLGATLVAAAFLLMLDTDDEPRAMKFSIAVVTFVGLCLVLGSVISIADLYIGNAGDVINRSKNQVLTDYLATAVLGAAASFLTWPVVSNFSYSGAGDFDGDDYENETEEDETPASEDEA